MNSEFVQLGDVADFINGYAFKPSDWGDEGKKIIRIQNLTNSDKPYNRTNVEVPEKYLVKNNDILVSWSATLDVFEWQNDDALLNQHIFKVVPDYEKVNKQYFKFALKKVITEVLSFLRGSTMKHINRGDFLSLKILLPPLPEQQRIADILDKAEAITQKREQALTICDEFLRATFLDMFGDPVSNPKGWEVKKLDEVILSIKAGKSLAGDSKPANENELGVLKVSAVSYGFFKPQENKKIEKVVDREKLIFPRKGDFLFSRANTRELVGATCIVQDDFEHVFLPDKLWLIDVNAEKVSAYYLHFLMLEPKFKDKLTSQATGTSGSMLNISQKKFVNTIAPIPPIEFQQKFSEIVEKVNAIKARIQHAQELPLFDALSQQAFKGELTQ